MVPQYFQKENEEYCKLDLLDRNQEAIELYDLISQYKEGIVASINGSYGSGKTFFLKMFLNVIDQNNKGKDGNIKVHYLYYNAWENELLDDPFSNILALFHELLLQISPSLETKERIERLKGTAKNMVKHFLPFIIGLASGNMALSKIGESRDVFLASATSYIESILFKDHNKTKAIKEFKTELINSIELSPSPIFIVIDELDRCSPKYVITFLELIKHFFSLPNIIFLLAIDKDQVLSSIEKEYGNRINAVSYLRKIITFQIKLKYPSYIPKFTLNTLHKYYPLVFKNFEHDSPALNHMDRLIEIFKLPPRDIEKIFLIFELLLRKDTRPIFMSVFAFTSFCLFYKFYSPVGYEELATNSNIDPIIDSYRSNHEFRDYLNHNNDEVKMVLTCLKIISSYKGLDSTFFSEAPIQSLIIPEFESRYSEKPKYIINIIDAIDIDA